MMAQPNPTVRIWRSSPYRSFEEFFSKNGVGAQYFSLDPFRRTTIIGRCGTRFTFYPFSLVDHTGKLIEKEVEVKLTEVYSKKEMILTDKVTTSEDRLLESGGQFCIEAFYEGQPVHLNAPLTVEVPVRCKLRNALAMHLFQGSISKTRGFQAERGFDWTQASNKPLSIRKIGQRKFFYFQITDFNWWNCDFYFSKRCSKTMVSARHVCHHDDFDDMVAFLAFDHLNSVARLYRGEHSFTSFNIPAKQSATMLMMALRDGQLYFGKRHISKTSNKLIYVKLEEVSEEETLEELQLL